jgi:TonB family protein
MHAASGRVVLLAALWLAATGHPLECLGAPATQTKLHLGPGFPIAQDFYPEEAILAGEEGPVVVRVCVDAQGQLTEAPAVATSSGHDTLDAGALKLAQAGAGHYSMQTADGTPAAGCSKFKVTFKLWSDPRWPELSRRLGVIMRGFSAKIPELLPHGPANADMNAGSLRQVAAGSEAGLKQLQIMFNDYMTAVGRLPDEPSLPLAERESFRSYWSTHRPNIQQAGLDFLAAAHDQATTVTGLCDYLDSIGVDSIGDPQNLTDEQQQRVGAFAARVKQAQDRIEAAVRILKDFPT